MIRRLFSAVRFAVRERQETVCPRSLAQRDRRRMACRGLTPAIAFFLTLSFELAPCSRAMAATLDQPVDVYQRAIAEYGIEPTRDGVSRFLRSVYDNSDRRAQTDRLISDLGDERFATRELATRILLALPAVPEEQLKAAIAGGDAEVRWRARQVLRHSRGRHLALVYAVLKTIELTPINGVTRELLLAIPHLQASDEQRRAALAALEASATADDAPLALSATKSKSATIRAAGIQLVGKLKGRESREQLRRALDDDAANVQLAAARELARIGDARCLAKLVALIDADERDVRVESHRILRTVTDQQIDFAGYDTPAMRRRGAEAWRQWLAQNKTNGALSLTLDRRQLRDRTLVCQVARNRVVEIDPTGREIWSTTAVARPWACQELATGHRLVASFDGRQLVEFDEAGVEVWQSAPLPGSVSSVERLPSGETLLAIPDAQRVVMLNSRGQIAAEKTVSGRPMDARRLANGHTLIALAALNKVVELDADGREAWNLSGLSGPSCALRLENGNTLVCESGASRVSEFTSQGRVIWTRTIHPNPQSIQRLSSGATLVSHAVGAAEISPGGKIVWRLDGDTFGKVSRY